MRHTLISVAIGVALSTSTVATTFVPDCAPHCWTNSKYVSTCADETKCLCEDDLFQSTVFQCLYTQCQTNHFAPALHYALSQCSEFDGGAVAILPHLIRQQGLMKREEYDSGVPLSYVSRSVSVSGSIYGYGSVYGSGSAISAVTTRRLITMPGSAYPRPAQVTASSDSPPPDKAFTNGVSLSTPTPTIFALSPTIPVVTATPEAIKLDTTGL